MIQTDKKYSRSKMAVTKKWWKEEVIYQIYPRSFQDSNGDGIGDIQGIISRLDHLKDLGIDIIWICPIYMSPNDDNGYDISDYYEIHSEFGSMADFDLLLDEVHNRGMRLIMDLVLNHSSDEHDWFKKSRASKDNPYRDYYFWKPGKNGGPPNNFNSIFGGSAWEYDKTTEEYYLHLFTKKQPDLNWESEALRNDVYDIIKYWLEKGIDGFRMDVIPCISKRLEFADTEIDDFNRVIEEVYANGPRVHEFINLMYEKAIKDYDVMTVGEGPGIKPHNCLLYIGEDRNELDFVFHLEHMFLGHGPLGKFDPVPFSWRDIKDIFQKWDDAIGDSGWISIFLDNHDFPRMVSRFGNDKEYRVESAQLLALLILTLRGTPCIYQGSEIGMTNVHFDSIDDYRDIEVFNVQKEYLGRGVSPEAYLRLVHDNGRDNVRTPMQWDASDHGGFTTGTPWINANPNYTSINVEKEKAKEHSIFSFYQQVLAFRKQHNTLVYGTYEEIPTVSEDLYVYKRIGDETLMIVLNHSDQHQNLQLDLAGMQLQLQNIDNSMTRVLLPWEARLYKMV